ncbi:hypothetical protein I5E68_14805 [Novosphingobium sp. YJ-S2-02]|uniref:Uncharacterized protein n=1 Tax=Novosphingobium aureum TaxID=2792964 RepID=A0A931HE87_9SPHN|nr:hypothetical protein [Novosphingobium aureum]MBH0114212.1 hypothetical protein [Novosphingobium aureum]
MGAYNPLFIPEFNPATLAFPPQRSKIEALVEQLIDMLDRYDGDPDVELNGDEEDSDGAELGDQSWAEWHTLRRQQQRAGHGLIAGYEDDEEDDAAEEDDPSGDVAYEDEPSGHRQAWWGQGPGCPISDPGEVS